MGRRLKFYTKLSRFNLVLSIDQYKVLLERKAYAKKYSERVKYKDLVEKWGIAQHHMASAVYRGIKQYDERIKEEERLNDYRRQIAARFVERGTRTSTVGVRANTAETGRSSLEQYTQSGIIRGGYSDFIRANYFEE